MNVATSAAKYSAPGQYLGFALQPVRLCFHLLTCPQGAQVSLEHLDDVAIHTADGGITLEQTKSALAQNPLSDWAPDLWKTIANWLSSAVGGELEVTKTQFRLYVTPIKGGDRARALSEATTSAEVAAIVAAIQRDLAKMKKPPACMTHLQAFLDATDDERAAVITRMMVVSADADPVEPLRKLLELTVPPGIIEPICHAAIGLAKEQADGLIRRGKPATLDADSFRANFRAFVQRNNLPGYLASFTGQPSPGDVDLVLSTRPTFVRQLELIEVTPDERVRAVSDFLRTSADKSVWADAGLIFERSLEEWDDGLIRRHSAIAGEISDLHGDKPAVVRGRLAYRRCGVLEAPLEGRAVPGHFVHGCLNALADVRRLGWHPEFNTLLDNEET